MQSVMQCDASSIKVKKQFASNFHRYTYNNNNSYANKGLSFW
jgi:hypothetical protein